ncbi:MAG: phage prohead protease, family/phage major capsid protein family [Alphaproteobacteria bacterium]|nr:phage prohead protease, family/phage major capsid protein family [Alphaproteobacteria bacterium]
MELETKAVEHGHEVKQAFEEFLSGFAAFKQANDERLAGLERRSGDVLNEEKVARIDTALTETKRKIDRRATWRRPRRRARRCRRGFSWPMPPMARRMLPPRATRRFKPRFKP